MPAIRFTRFRAEVEELYAPPERSRKTYLKMRQVMREFGESGVTKTSDMTDLAIVRWKKANPSRSPWTNRSLLLSWRAACNIALSKRYLKTSPFAVRKLESWIELDEPDCVRHHALLTIGKVIAHLGTKIGRSWEDHRLYALASTVAWTGVRAGEAQHSMVVDFKLDDGIFMIDTRRKRKTKASAQPVPIPEALAAIQRVWLPLSGSVWAFPGVRRKSPWVSGSPGSKPLDRLKAVALEVGVEGFTFQSLRHSFATHAEGPWQMSDPQIQRVLRHTTIRTSKTFYRHPDLPNLREIGCKVVIPIVA